jgi:hypothetical protein
MDWVMHSIRPEGRIDAGLVGAQVPVGGHAKEEHEEKSYNQDSGFDDVPDDAHCISPNQRLTAGWAANPAPALGASIAQSGVSVNVRPAVSPIKVQVRTPYRRRSNSVGAQHCSSRQYRQCCAPGRSPRPQGPPGANAIQPRIYSPPGSEGTRRSRGRASARPNRRTDAPLGRFHHPVP